MLSETNPSKTYFMIPAMPTPNGRLHLGHIGGPFLAVDVLARHLRLAGHKTVVISGTDSYDSYITGQSVKENKTPAEICNHYHEGIASDLAAMQIGFDRFVNPLSSEWAPTYRNWHDRVLNQLKESGITSVQEETVALDDESGRFLTGCWLPGSCPNCSAAVCGYFCEDCGSHFRPEEVIDAPKTKQKRRVRNLFMSLPQQSNLDGRGLDPTILAVYNMFAKGNNSLLRLTANSEWGMKIENQEEGDRFFNYPFAYAYALMLGELAGKIAGKDVNALGADSGIVTVGAFGIDNTIPVLGSIEGITDSLKQYKQFDYYLVNHFLTLEGSKFSTSRRHAIWVEDVARVGASSDIVRLFLAGIETHEAAGDVSYARLVEFYNRTVDWIDRLLVNAMSKVFTHNDANGKQFITEKLDALLSRQEQSLDPAGYRLANASAVIEEWIALGEELNQYTETYFWWMQGLVLLAYPFMPRLAETLWAKLGYSGEPRIAEFGTLPQAAIQRDLPTNLKRLKATDFAALAEKV